MRRVFLTHLELRTLEWYIANRPCELRSRLQLVCYTLVNQTPRTWCPCYSPNSSQKHLAMLHERFRTPKVDTRTFSSLPGRCVSKQARKLSQLLQQQERTGGRTSWPEKGQDGGSGETQETGLVEIVLGDAEVVLPSWLRAKIHMCCRPWASMLRTAAISARVKLHYAESVLPSCEHNVAGANVGTTVNVFGCEDGGADGGGQQEKGLDFRCVVPASEFYTGTEIR